MLVHFTRSLSSHIVFWNTSILPSLEFSRKCKKQDIIFAKYTINPTLIHHQKICLEADLFYEFVYVNILFAYLKPPCFITIQTDSPKNTLVGKACINLCFTVQTFFLLQNDPLLFLSTSRWQSRHTTTQLSRLLSFLPSTWWNSACLQYQLQ